MMKKIALSAILAGQAFGFAVASTNVENKEAKNKENVETIVAAELEMTDQQKKISTHLAAALVGFAAGFAASHYDVVGKIKAKCPCNKPVAPVAPAAPVVDPAA